MISMCLILILYDVDNESHLAISRAMNTREECAELSHVAGDVMDEIGMKGEVRMIWGAPTKI